MEFTSTKGMTNDTAPEGKCLVQYLVPFFGYFEIEVGIAYYDNPNDYNNTGGDGWLLWNGDKKINVISYISLEKEEDSKLIKSRFKSMKQSDFYEEFNDWHPNLGSIGE